MPACHKIVLYKQFSLRDPKSALKYQHKNPKGGVKMNFFRGSVKGKGMKVGSLTVICY